MIAQEDFSGCAVACVAALLEVSYQCALAHFEHSEYATLRGYYCKEVIAALEHAGVNATLKYVKPRLIPGLNKPGTIVFVAKGGMYPNGHYLLRLEDGWMNSWVNFPRMEPAQAGMQTELPGRPQFAIFTEPT